MTKWKQIVGVVLVLAILSVPFSFAIASDTQGNLEQGANAWLQSNMKIDEQSDEPNSNIDWTAFAFARSGDKTLAYTYKAYIENLVKLHLQDGSLLYSTDFARIGLAFEANGINSTDIMGENFVEIVAAKPVAGYSYTAELATDILYLSSKEYDGVTADDIDTRLVALIATQRSDDGFNSMMQPIDGDGNEWTHGGDVDATAMVLAALAPYKDRADMKTVIEKALAFVRASQKENGGFGGAWGDSAETTSQIIIALTSLGIDPMGDIWKTAGGKSALDALQEYAGENGGFIAYDGKENLMTTWQAYSALVAFNRFNQSKTSLYDLRDVKEIEIEKEKETESSTTQSVTSDKTEETKNTGNVPATGDRGAKTFLALFALTLGGIAFARKKDEKNS